MSESPRDPELLLRRLEWTVIRRLDGAVHGNYRTLFRGFGLDLADLREYQYHDDVRHIDWNVTARLDQPHVRVYREDREVAAWFLLALVDLVFTSSPGIWLVLLVATLAFYALLLAFTRKKRAVRSVTARPTRKILFTGLVSLGLLAGLSGIGLAAYSQLRTLTNTPLLLSRQDHWQVAWRMITTSPFFGTGPDTFYRSWLAMKPFSANGLAVNPRSIYLSVASETGIIGLALFLLLTGAALWKLIKAAGQSQRDDHLTMAAIAAGLAGILVMSAGEISAFLFPTILVPILLLALGLAPEPPAGEMPGHARAPVSAAVFFAPPARRMPAWMVFILYADLAVVGLLQAPGLAWYEESVAQAGAGRWDEASRLVEQAAAADPGFAWYELQAGYARGMAAQTALGRPDPAQINLAIQHYLKGIALEPAYALNHANLAVLYWQAGQPDAAIGQMETAVQKDPSATLYLLNLGWMLESNGEETKAGDVYERAALTSTALKQSPFWSGSALRRKIWQGWQTPLAAPAPGIPAGYQALQSGDLAGAAPARASWPK